MSNYDVFISYSRKDDDDKFVTRLKAALEREGLRVWMDDQMMPSAEWWEQIERHIERSSNFLLLISEHSLSSEWCQKEIAHAFANGKRIIPFQLSEFNEKSVKGGWLDQTWEQIARQNWEPLRKIQWNRAYLTSPDFDAAVAAICSDARQDAASVEAHQRLLQQAQTWRNSGESPGALISGDPLAQAEAWLARWDDATEDASQPNATDEQRAFIAACRAAQEDAKRRTADDERRTRRLRRATAIAAMVGALAGVALIIAGFRLIALNHAVIQSENRFTSILLGSQALESLPHRPVHAALLSIRALNVAYTEQADVALSRATDNLCTGAILRIHEGVMYSATYSPDGRFIITASADGNARIWDAESGEEVRALQGHEDDVMSAEYSPDGSFIVTANSDGTARI
jgi:hypothetical protein